MSKTFVICDLDRIDVNGNYSCGKCKQCKENGWESNVRWADGETQAKNKRKTPAHNAVNMLGMKIASLTVIRSAPSKNKAAQWVCLCDCGKETIVSRAALLAAMKGKACGTRTCGCSRATGKGSRPEYSRTQSLLTTAQNRAFGGYKKAAKKRNLEFSLSKEDFHGIVSQDCHYCGQSPLLVKRSTSIHKENAEYKHNGIDRKDNNKGYTLENSLPCCSICNHAKHTLSYDEFNNWIKKTYLYGGKNRETTKEEEMICQ